MMNMTHCIFVLYNILFSDSWVMRKHTSERPKLNMCISPLMLFPNIEMEPIPADWESGEVPWDLKEDDKNGTTTTKSEKGIRFPLNPDPHFMNMYLI